MSKKKKLCEIINLNLPLFFLAFSIISLNIFDIVLNFDYKFKLPEFSDIFSYPNLFRMFLKLPT